MARGWMWGGLIGLVLLPTAVSATEIIAHRGASFDAPENTLASVNLAWQQQADAVEIDIYLSKDDQIVVMHDKTPKRYGGPDRPVVEMTWEELRELDVGTWKAPQFAHEKVPHFEDVVKSIPAGHRLFIEVKCGPEILPILKKSLETVGRPASETCIISFNTEVIEEAGKLLPDLERYWVVSMETGKEKKVVTAEELVKTAQRIRASGVDLGGKTNHIDAALLEQLTHEKIPCYVWTVNDPDEALRLAKLGVKGITTDRPELLRSEGVAEAFLPQ